MSSGIGQPSENMDHPVYLRRPAYQLRSLPLRYRWEATRRHPSYQLGWRRARAFRRNEPTVDECEKILQMAAVFMLGQIDVVGVPEDPARSFEELEAELLNSGWLPGALHPITLRNMTALLMAAMSKDTLRQVGERMLLASQADSEGQPPHQILAVMEMERLDAPGLDTYLTEPVILSINPAASAKQISAALDVLLPQWRAVRQLNERRDRSDKYSEYLRVWDLREGWTGGNYNRASEQTFIQIAAVLKLPVTTVNNHYRKAFELIVGHPYTPSSWYGAFGVLKLSKVIDGTLGPVSRRRPLNSPRARDVTETALGNVSRSQTEAGLISATAVASCDEGWELLSDIEDLVSLGRSEEEIIEELELPRQAFEEITYLRSRILDSASKPRQSAPHRKK